MHVAETSKGPHMLTAVTDTVLPGTLAPENSWPISTHFLLPAGKRAAGGWGRVIYACAPPTFPVGIRSPKEDKQGSQKPDVVSLRQCPKVISNSSPKINKNLAALNQGSVTARFRLILLVSYRLAHLNSHFKYSKSVLSIKAFPWDGTHTARC